MHHQMSPFIQHALRHGQTILNESNRAVSISGNLVRACDEIIMSIQSGNSQGAVNLAQNARNMAMQVARDTQEMNTTISERIEMASHAVSMIQNRINEISNALNSLRGAGITTGFGSSLDPYQFNRSYQQLNRSTMM